MSSRAKDSQHNATHIRDEIARIKTAIRVAKQQHERGVITEKNIEKKSKELQDKIDELRTMTQSLPDTIVDAVNLEDEIIQLEIQINFPNLRDEIFSRQQEEEQKRASVALNMWSIAGVGVSMKDLSPDEIGELSLCATARWSPLTTKIEELVQANKDEDTKLVSSYRNVAIGCFNAVVPQWFGHDIPKESTMADLDQQRLLACIAQVAVDICQDNYNPLSVFAEAISSGNLKTVGDIVGGGFGLGVLLETGGMTVLEAAANLRSLAGKAVTYVVTNPAASFVTYTAVEPYISALINQVLNERFHRGRQRPEDIKELFDRLSEYYRHNGVTDIIGFPPADLDSIRNKLSQLLYEAGYRVLSSAQILGGTVNAALKFPMTLCVKAKEMGDHIMRKWSNLGTKLIDRYGFMPHNMENGWFPRVMMCLNEAGLLNGQHEFIELAVRRCLNHSLPTIPYHHLVERLKHLSDVQYGALLSPGSFSESLEATKDYDSPQQHLEHRGPDTGSGAVSGMGEIQTDPVVPSSNGDALADFRIKMQVTMARAIKETNSIAENIQRDIEQKKQIAVAQGGAQAPPAAAQPGSFFPPAGAQGSAQGFAQGFAQGGVASSVFNSGPRANTYTASGGPPRDGPPRGGRYHSHKRSASKRTRRKGVAKKEKSKKNKRQSRRKVRRASSRKGRK